VVAEPSDEVLASLGRVMVKAAQLEGALGTVAGERLGLNMIDVLGKPGKSLRAARRAVDLMPEEDRHLFIPHIERAAELLARRHLFVHALWVDTQDDQGMPRPLAIHMRTFTRTPIEAPALNDFARQLGDAYTSLIELLTDQINGRLASPRRCSLR